MGAGTDGSVACATGMGGPQGTMSRRAGRGETSGETPRDPARLALPELRHTRLRRADERPGGWTIYVAVRIAMGRMLDYIR